MVMDDDRGAVLALMLAPAKAYRELLYRPGGELSRWLGEHFEIVAQPGLRLTEPPRSGDVLLTVTLGQLGAGEYGVLSGVMLKRRRGGHPGWYCTMAGTTAARRRRVLDPHRKLLPGNLLLRQRATAVDSAPVALPPQESLGDATAAVTAPPALQSPRFQGDRDLEAVLRGNLRLAARGTSPKPAPVLSSGPAIVKVQRALIDLAYPLPRFGADGAFGSETGSAVVKFKTDMQIKPNDPVIGRLTMAALDEVIRDHDGKAHPVAGTPTITAKDTVVVVRKPYTSPARRRIELGASAGFTGTGTFTVSKPDRIRFFDAVTAGNAVAGGAVFTAAQLQAGVVVFAEGVKASDKVDDVVLTLTLSAGGKRGQSISKALTAVELFLDIHASRTSTTTLPGALNTAQKLNPGRFVHLQDAGFHHGRAMLTVQPAKPKDFAGKLVVEAIGAKPRVRLFDAKDEVAAGGQASLGPKVAAIPATGRRFWVEGAEASGALRDVDVRLGVDGLEPDGDRAVLTVVQFSNLQATIPGTPPHTARLANGPVAPHVFTVGANGFDEDPTVNAPLPLVENSVVNANPVALEVTVAPAGTPVSWSAQRASGIPAASGGDDAAAIVALHAAKAPTVRVTAGNNRRATLLADNSGTFHVRPFVDCNGNGRFDHKIDREPNMVLNLVLGRVTLRQDNSVARSANFAVTPVAGGGISVTSGAFAIATPNTAAIHMNAQVDVVTGGANGRRAIGNFFGGWINNEVAPETIEGTYTDATVTPNRVLRTPSLFASNATAASLPTQTGRAFAPTDPAPAILAVPLLDSGQIGAGAGGNSAALTRSRIRNRTNQALGERWIVEAVDSPGDGDAGTHPRVAAARLTAFNFGLTFGAFLAVWTNSSGASGATVHPANRTYAVLRRVNWTQNGRWTITPATGAITQVVAPTTAIPSTVTTSPAVAAATTGVEVRPPVATDSIARDAR